MFFSFAGTHFLLRGSDGGKSGAGEFVYFQTKVQ